MRLRGANTEYDGRMLKVPDTQIVIRTDNSQPLAAVGEKYSPIQNRQLFELADTVVRETRAEYETTGTLGLGEQVFVLLRFSEDIEVTNDPEGRIEKYFLIRSSHDGSSAMDIRFTPVRVVCQNTLNFALTARKRRFPSAILSRGPD